MLAKLAWSVALGGASLALGASPALAAATGPGGTNSTAAPCAARAQAVLTRLDKMDHRITTVLGRLETAEQKAQSNGRTKLAERIGDRITRVEDRQRKVEARVARIEQRCPGLQATSGQATSS